MNPTAIASSGASQIRAMKIMLIRQTPIHLTHTAPKCLVPEDFRVYIVRIAAIGSPLTTILLLQLVQLVGVLFYAATLVVVLGKVVYTRPFSWILGLTTGKELVRKLSGVWQLICLNESTANGGTGDRWFREMRESVTCKRSPKQTRFGIMIVSSVCLPRIVAAKIKFQIAWKRRKSDNNECNYYESHPFHSAAKEFRFHNNMHGFNYSGFINASVTSFFTATSRT